MIPRNLALAALNSLDHDAGFPERFLDRAFRQEPYLDERDRAFTVHLVQGVLRWRLRLDWIIKQFTRFPFKSIEPPILNILRLAVYQMFFMDRIPESAAVNEAVKQARGNDRKYVAGFVNGILRHICRQREHIIFPERGNDLVRYLSVFYSYPAWLVKKWIRELGVDSAERLLAAGNRIPSLVIRANTLKISRADLVERFKRERIIARPTRYSPEGIEIESPCGPVNRLKAFEEGLFQVQGEAAQICSHFLSPMKGERILDICAGLGGKSTHLAELTGDRGWILALDISHSRLVSFGHNIRRLEIDCVHPVVADACDHLSSLFHSAFDKIFVDGPCSALGVISRHPDGKWARNERDIKRLSLLQTKILNEAAPLLRKGGKLLYITCTISSEENEQVVRSFLKKNREMTLENLKNHVPTWGLDLIDNQGFYKALPHIHGMDGFFGALFTKKDL